MLQLVVCAMESFGIHSFCCRITLSSDHLCIAVDIVYTREQVRLLKLYQDEALTQNVSVLKPGFFMESKIDLS